jgi:hypothetical protein
MKRIFFFTSVIIASALALYFLFSSPAKTSFIIDESFTSQILSSNKRAGQDAPILLQKNGPLDRILSKTASGNLLLTSSLS